jgi:hypothetical protein
MWIKWQNLTTPARPLARRLPACLASPRPAAAARMRVALLCPFLSFSIKMDNFQPNKLSQRSVKILYDIKSYNA